MSSYIRDFVTSWAAPARRLYNEMYPNDTMSKFEAMRIIEPFLNDATLYGALNNYLLGWLKPKLAEIDDIRLSKWNKYYNIDASESTIPLKFGLQSNNNNKYRLNASDSHVACDWGYLLGYTRFLEKCGEGYDKIFVQQTSFIIAKNMRKVKDFDEFTLKFSLDTGTRANADNIRNCLIEGILSHLRCNQLQSEVLSDRFFTNQYGVTFDLASLSITVKYFYINNTITDNHI